MRGFDLSLDLQRLWQSVTIEIMARRRTQLVCQHLENVSRHALEKYQNIIRDHVRGRHGVYALYRRDKLYYVGLAKNLRTRLKAHLRDRHGESWDRFSVYLTIGDHHMKEIESLVLRIVRPKGNKQMGKLGRSQNLRVLLARQLREYHRAELRDLFSPLKRAVRAQLRRIKTAKNGRTPVMAKYTDESIKLQARFKGKTVRARVLSNGLVRHNGKDYNSPSLAAAAACGRRTCNGWSFWTYERAPGDWVRLNQLKQ